MNVYDLRTSLQTLLGSLVGTYTLANGMTTPAVSVRNTGEAMPPGTSVTGLEVIVIRDPELEPVPAYRQQEAFRRWTVYLVDWSNTGGTSRAAGNILIEYPGTTVTDVVVPEGLGPQSQKRLVITTEPDRALGLGDS